MTGASNTSVLGVSNTDGRQPSTRSVTNKSNISISGIGNTSVSGVSNIHRNQESVNIGNTNVTRTGRNRHSMPATATNSNTGM